MILFLQQSTTISMKACLLLWVISLLVFLLESTFSMVLAGSSPTSFRRGLVPTPLGKIHYTAVGPEQKQTDDSKKLLPIVGFHMSPRSVDEYKEVMQLVCSAEEDAGRLFIAMDEFGYGQSDIPNKACSLDEIADCFLAVLDELGVKKCIAAGSLMGCYFALSLAARYPDRIQGVVCTNLYYFQQEAREKALEADKNPEKRVLDSWDIKEDGSHISGIWGARSSWLSPALNTRATFDNLNYLMKRQERYEKGIYIQDGGAFPLQDTCAKVKCPVLCVNGAAAVAFFDMIGMNMSGQFQEALAFFPSDNKPETAVIEKPGASINMVNENAKEWYEKVSAFADKVGA